MPRFAGNDMGHTRTTYKRFYRRRTACVWDRLMDVVIKAHHGEVQMIDSSIVRVQQQASGHEAAAGSRRVANASGDDAGRLAGSPHSVLTGAAE